ncbi:MAG: ATP-binding protein [Pseudomonadales bacterium]
MARLFITLYIGIIGAVFAVYTSLDALAPRISMKLSVEDLQGFALSSSHLYQEIYQLGGEERMWQAMLRTAQLEQRLVSIVTDPDILNAERIRTMPKPGVLIEGEDEALSYYFKLASTDKLYLNSPDKETNLWKRSRQFNHIYRITFFLVVAVALLAWIYLLQRKLKMLERSALRISQGDFSARAPSKYKHQVGDLNQAFNTMAERIEELVASHKRLTSAIAHELRTPIFRLRCQLELFEDMGLDVEQQSYLKGMDEDLSELDELIDTQLKYARMERVGVQLEKTQHSLSQWLAEHRDIWQRSSKCQLDVKPGEPGQVSFDEKVMHSALNNLVRNADKYAGSRIEISVEITSTHAFIYVDDDGSGVPECERERIFEPFERLDDARTRNSGGYGLGLSIVREIVLAHGGSVHVEQAPLGGARFVLQLPL